jgi:hypothetical protein
MVFLPNLFLKEEPYGQINGRQEGHKKEAGQNRQGEEEGQAGKKEEIDLVRHRKIALPLPAWVRAGSGGPFPFRHTFPPVLSNPGSYPALLKR